MQLGERQRALVAALRSGKYSQTKSRLHSKEGFCCLGVACDISAMGDWIIIAGTEAEFEIPYYVYAVAERASDSSLLPSPVQEYFGFKSDSGSFAEALGPGMIDGKTELTALNDKDWTFEQIADLIEEQAENLFTEPK